MEPARALDVWARELQWASPGLRHWEQLWGEAGSPCSFFQHLPAWPLRALDRQDWQRIYYLFCRPWQPEASGTCELCPCLEEQKTTDWLSGWFFSSVLSKKRVWGFSVPLTVLQRCAYWSIQGEMLLQFLCRSGGFCRLLWKPERSTTGQWALEGPAQPLTPTPWPSSPGRWWGVGGWETDLPQSASFWRLIRCEWGESWIVSLFLLLLWLMPL